MRILSPILMGIGVIGIIIFLLLISGLLLYSLTPSIKGHMNEAEVSFEAVESFDQKFETFEEEIKEAAAAKEARTIRLIITEEEINSKVVELIAENKLPMKELIINFNEDLCWVYVELRNPGIDAKSGVIVNLEAVDGEVKFKVFDFHLGRLLLPKSADDWLASLLEVVATTQSPIEDLPVTLTGIEIGEDDFTYEVQTKVQE